MARPNAERTSATRSVTCDAVGASSTNPSLVEALAAGNPVIAHDNKYNTWVAGDAGLYFATATDADYDPPSPEGGTALEVATHG